MNIIVNKYHQVNFQIIISKIINLLYRIFIYLFQLPVDHSQILLHNHLEYYQPFNKDSLQITNLINPYNSIIITIIDKDTLINKIGLNRRILITNKTNKIRFIAHLSHIIIILLIDYLLHLNIRLQLML